MYHPDHAARRRMYDQWAKLGPVKRDALGRFARRNRGGPGRPPNAHYRNPPLFDRQGNIHPYYMLSMEGLMNAHDEPLLINTPANRDKLHYAMHLWQQLAEEVLQPEWYGVATIELKIEAGVIQHVEAKSTHRQR